MSPTVVTNTDHYRWTPLITTHSLITCSWCHLRHCREEKRPLSWRRLPCCHVDCPAYAVVIAPRSRLFRALARAASRLGASRLGVPALTVDALARRRRRRRRRRRQCACSCRGLREWGGGVLQVLGEGGLAPLSRLRWDRHLLREAQLLDLEDGFVRRHQAPTRPQIAEASVLTH